MTPEELNAAVEHQLDLCEEQGFPRYVEDPAVLAAVAEVLRPLMVAEARKRREDAVRPRPTARRKAGTPSLATSAPAAKSTQQGGVR